MMMEKQSGKDLQPHGADLSSPPSESFIFDKLLQLPLWQGMGRADVLAIAGQAKIGFVQKAKGACIVEQGSVCQSLIFVVEGEVCTYTSSADRGYQLTEWINLPHVIQPECLFGVQTRYLRSVYAAGKVQLLEITKSAVRDFLFDFPTFRINFLNISCWQSQQYMRRLWENYATTIEARFVQFILRRSQRPAGKKELKIKMTRLAEELGETRLSVSFMLRKLEAKGLLESNRQRITIPAFEQLVNS